MRLEQWVRIDADGAEEEDFARYKRDSLPGEVRGLKLGNVWYQSVDEATSAGWIYRGYVDLNPAP